MCVVAQRRAEVGEGVLPYTISYEFDVRPAAQRARRGWRAARGRGALHGTAASGVCHGAGDDAAQPAGRVCGVPCGCPSMPALCCACLISFFQSSNIMTSKTDCHGHVDLLVTLGRHNCLHALSSRVLHRWPSRHSLTLEESWHWPLRCTTSLRCVSRHILFTCIVLFTGRAFSVPFCAENVCILMA